MADALAVWLNDTKIAVIEQERNRLRLFYTEEALERFALGVPLLSLSLPIAERRYPNGIVRAFLDGLLPEGDVRRAVAEQLDIRATDTYALIRALGRDCAGALVIQPENEAAPPRPTTETAEPLTDHEVAELVANLRNAPLGVNARVRMSLAGVHEKLLLTRMRDGLWGRPVNGTPSTHILKPSIAQHPNTVENEAFCMRLARHLRLPVAAIDTITINGRKAIIVERYDRVVHPDRSVERIHQEDFCQALGIPPDKKYEQDGGPSLSRIAVITQGVAGSASLETLLRAVTLNVLIGNGDAHAKNFSLLHNPSGALSFAPLYDLLSTLVYKDDRLAMYIDSVRRTNRVTADRIINEAAEWGLPRSRAAQIIADILDRAPAAVEAAREETEDVPGDLLRVVETQSDQLRSSFDRRSTHTRSPVQAPARKKR